jgi:hypothetical protein
MGNAVTALYFYDDGNGTSRNLDANGLVCVVTKTTVMSTLDTVFLGNYQSRRVGQEESYLVLGTLFQLCILAANRFHSIRLVKIPLRLDRYDTNITVGHTTDRDVFLALIFFGWCREANYRTSTFLSIHSNSQHDVCIIPSFDSIGHGYKQ